jgi:hypothetical protein
MHWYHYALIVLTVWMSYAWIIWVRAMRLTVRLNAVKRMTRILVRHF